MARVLVIDDDRGVCEQIRRALAETDLEVVSVQTAAEGLAAARTAPPDCVLLDVMLPETSGLDLYREFRKVDSKTPVVFITGGGTSDTAIEAMKLGAYDYILKPLELPHVRDLVLRAVEIRRLMQVPVELPKAEAPAEGDPIVGRSAAMQDVYKSIGRVAPQDVTVLIRGESGTGKELVARAIYQHSHRNRGPFLAVNCAAIPETLLESELFGHEKGSFTGAQARRIGKFEQCSGGTIFLDEVGDMSPLVQSKMLRLLQDQQFERVGSNETISTDVRIIAATNRDLETMVADGEYREDLYYRLNGFTVKLPPLRDRGGDLLLLLEHYLHRFRRELDKDVHGVSPDALQRLMQYLWPGNVRELQSVVRQSMLQATGPVIVPEFLPEPVRSGDSPAPANGTATASGAAAGGGDVARFIEERIRSGTNDLYAEALELLEEQLLTRVLQHTAGNQSQAARLLGITRGSLRNKIRLLGIALGRTVSVRDEGSEADVEEEAV